MVKKLKSIFQNKNLILLMLIILLGTLLRFTGLDKPSGMWFDELMSYTAAKQSFPLGILKILYFDVHPPLYYFVMHSWMWLFGDSDYILRLSSVIFGILTIPVIYLAGKELNSRNTGLIAALLLSINSLMIYFSQEARVYSFLTFLCTLSVYFLIRLKNNPTKSNYTSLILTNLALIYTYFTGCTFVFFETCIMLVYLFYKDRKNMKPFIYAQVITFSLFIPYIRTFVHQYNFANLYCLIWQDFTPWKFLFLAHDWFSPVMINLNYAKPDFYLNLFFSKPTTFNTHIYSNSIFYFIVFAIFPVIAYFSGIIKAITRKKFVLAIFALGSVFFIFEVISALNGKIVFETRYTSFLVPIFILIAAYGFSEFKNIYLKIFLVSSIVFLNLFYLIFNPYSTPKLQRTGGYKSIVEVTNKYNFNKDDIVIAHWSPKEYVSKYYLENKGKECPEIMSSRAYNLLMKITDPKDKYKGSVFSDRKMVKAYLLSDDVPEPLKDYFKNQILKKMKKDRYFAISFVGNLLSNKEIRRITSSNELYYKTNTFDLYYPKIFNSFTQVANQNLKLVSINKNKAWTVYIYQRLK